MKILSLVILALFLCLNVSAQSVTDNFQRANGALGSNWTVVNGSLQISSNTVVGGTNAVSNSSIYTGAGSFPPDQQASIKMSGSLNVNAVVTVRASSSAVTDYECTESNTTAYVSKRVSGSWTGLATASVTGAIGDTITCSATGSTISVLQNGIVKATATDTQITSGYPGILIYSNTTDAASNFSASPAGPTASQLTWSQPQTFSPGINVGGPITNTSAAPWIWSGPAGSCGTPPSVTSTSGSSFCIGDSNGAPNGSVNGDAWLPLTRTVGKGTATFATTPISAGACSAVVSPALTAIASTDTIKWSYQTQPTAGTDAALTITMWPTSGTGLNFKRCNTTASSITPTAIVINWEVTR